MHGMDYRVPKLPIGRDVYTPVIGDELTCEVQAASKGHAYAVAQFFAGKG